MHKFPTFKINQYLWVSNLPSRSCYRRCFYWNSI
nr:MAG TPA: hypothetical protein [Caudoviricetes sp.]